LAVTEIDADAVGRFQRGQQVAVAAAQFQHPLSGRDQELHESVVVVVIGGVDFAPAVDVVDIGLVMVEQIALALAGKLQRRGPIGRPQIHHASENKGFPLSSVVLESKFDWFAAVHCGGRSSMP
jgi:hypothetical protein